MYDGVMNGVKVVLFDVDETLYPASCGLREALDDQVEKYLTKRLGVSSYDARLARLNYEKYGTCLAGLIAEKPKDFIVDDFVAEVYDAVDYSLYIKPDPTLRKTLEEVSAHRRVWAFSNSRREHVLAVLKALDVPRSLFDGVVEAQGLGYVAKPAREAFEKALRAAGDCEPREVLLIDDSDECVEAARAFGMRAVHVSNAGQELAGNGGVDYKSITGSPLISKNAQSCMITPLELKSCYPDLVQRGHF